MTVQRSSTATQISTVLDEGMPSPAPAPTAEELAQALAPPEPAPPPVDAEVLRLRGIHSNLREVEHARLLTEISKDDFYTEPVFADGSVEQFVDERNSRSADTGTTRNVMRIVVDADGNLRKLFVQTA